MPNEFATVTCHTEGCGNAGISIEVCIGYDDDVTGEQIHSDHVYCGVCGQEITDIQEVSG
jgi:hypothetical protein